MEQNETNKGKGHGLLGQCSKWESQSSKHCSSLKRSQNGLYRYMLASNQIHFPFAFFLCIKWEGYMLNLSTTLAAKLCQFLEMQCLESPSGNHQF